MLIHCFDIVVAIRQLYIGRHNELPLISAGPLIQKHTGSIIQKNISIPVKTGYLESTLRWVREYFEIRQSGLIGLRQDKMYAFSHG